MTTTRRRRLGALVAALAGLGLILAGSTPAQAASYVRISGEGSSWAGNAWLDFAANAQRQGVTVDYTANGSSQGRDDFARQSSAAFADSEIPFTGDASDPSDTILPSFKYGMLPVVAGGTAFMYNLPIGGTQFQNLQLDLPTVAGIFSGQITMWNDPKILATNPGVQLPAHVIDVVVRSEGSGATAQFKLWMLRQFPQQYSALAKATGGDPNHASSYFPTGTLQNFIAQNGSTGVTTYTQNTPYTINYDEYSYALQAGFPVAKIKNAAGFYTTPTQSAVAVALIAAKINTNESDPNYLSQDLSNVYSYGDPRAYPMSMYSYMIVPTQTNLVTNNDKGASIAWVATNALCEWQRDMGPLGYSPLPMNLVLAGFDQIKKVPGIDAATSQTISSAVSGTLNGGANPCNNPTFQPGDDPAHNILVDTAAFPQGCDAACQAPWKSPDAGVNKGPNSGGKKPVKAATSKPSSNAGGKTGAGQPSVPSGGSTGGAAGSNPDSGPTDGASDAPSVGSDPGASSQPSCDADTGVCSDASGQSGQNGGTQSAANVQQVAPTVIANDGGWGTTQWLGLAVGVLMFAALIAAPPIVTIATRRRKGGDGR